MAAPIAVSPSSLPNFRRARILASFDLSARYFLLNIFLAPGNALSFSGSSSCFSALEVPSSRSTSSTQIIVFLFDSVSLISNELFGFTNPVEGVTQVPSLIFFMTVLNFTLEPYFGNLPSSSSTSSLYMFNSNGFGPPLLYT